MKKASPSLRLAVWSLWVWTLGLQTVFAEHPASGNRPVPIVTTVGGLAIYAVKGAVVGVSDGTGATDCTTGGGTTAVACQYSGSAWAAVGGGGGPATPVSIANGGTGTGSTLVGLVRGNASAMTAAELSGDATTSGSNAVTVVMVNGN